MICVTPSLVVIIDFIDWLEVGEKLQKKRELTTSKKKKKKERETEECQSDTVTLVHGFKIIYLKWD